MKIILALFVLASLQMAAFADDYLYRQDVIRSNIRMEKFRLAIKAIDTLPPGGDKMSVMEGLSSALKAEEELRELLEEVTQNRVSLKVADVRPIKPGRDQVIDKGYKAIASLEDSTSKESLYMMYSEAFFVAGAMDELERWKFSGVKTKTLDHVFEHTDERLIRIIRLVAEVKKAFNPGVDRDAVVAGLMAASSMEGIVSDNAQAYKAGAAK